MVTRHLYEYPSMTGGIRDKGAQIERIIINDSSSDHLKDRSRAIINQEIGMNVLKSQKVQITTLKKASQAHEGYNGDESEYVLQMAHSCDSAILAVSLSNQEIKLYDRSGLDAVGSFKGHQGPITSLCFSPDTSSTLASSSEDKTVRLWDTRTKGSIAGAVLTEDDEALCCSLAPTTGLLAVGVGTHVKFFDIRKPSSPLGQYTDAHTDDITKVLFHPSQPTMLASGSEDGLICTYNTGVAQADEAVTCIMNADCPIRDMTFFGPLGDGIAVLTGSEGMSIWHWPSARRLMEMADLRQISATWGPSPHFAIQYHYDVANERLLLASGDVEGHVTIAEILPAGSILPIYKLQKGHQALVRCLDYGGVNESTIITGGEDARLIQWSSSQQQQAPTTSIPTAMRYERANKMKGDHRHRPY